MSKLQKTAQSGFTLVELAVVMIIIGLLIGGVLKGQELINNAQIAATVAQVKSVDAATTTFRDMYAAYPGDMVGPANRLSNCSTAPCNVAGDGNGQLDRLPNGYAADDEAAQFFVHLAAADLITGVNGSNTVAWGTIYPAAKIAGGFHPSYTNGTAGNFVANGTDAMGGFYLTLTRTPGAAPAAGTGPITPNQAARLDTKIDDGRAVTGGVRAFGTNCETSAPPSGGGAAVPTGSYDEKSAAKVCGLHVRFQG